jgi:hypothetical protein
MDLPTGASRFVFILAHPAAHVVAPRYYTPFFQAAGLDWHMVPLDVAPENFSDAIRAREVKERRGLQPDHAAQAGGLRALRRGRPGGGVRRRGQHDPD